MRTDGNIIAKFEIIMLIEPYSPGGWTTVDGDDRDHVHHQHGSLARPFLERRGKKNGYTCPPCPHVVLVQGQNKCCFIYSGDACCRSVLVGRRAQKPPKATTNRRRRRRRCHLPENIKILPSNDDDCAFELCGTRPPATHRAPRFLAPTRIVGRPSHVVETLVPFLKDQKRSLR